MTILSSFGGSTDMADQAVLQRVIGATSRVLGLDPGTIEPGANFVFDLGAESIQGVQLVAAFEEEFNIDMDQEAALAVQTVEAAADFIAKNYLNK
jgi:acyl carrier protein